MKQFIRKSSLFAGFFVLMLSLTLVKPMKTSAQTLSVSNGMDITKTFQAALDSGGSIEVPAGTYTINNTLRVYSNTKITLDKNAVIRRSPKGKNYSMLRFGSYEDRKSGYSGFQNITISGGVWDGANYSNPIFRFGHAENVTVQGVTFQNVKESHFAEIAACRNVTFNGCVFTGLNGSKTSGENREALQIDVMRQEHFNQYAEYDETPCANITVQNCTFDGVQRGVGSHSAVAGSYFSGVKIINNIFKNIPGYAIIATNYVNATISGNNIEDCGAGIIFRSANKDDKAYYKPNNGSMTIQSSANSVIEKNTIKVKYLGYPNMAVGISLFGANLPNGSGSVPAGDYTLRGVSVLNNNITLTCRGLALCLEGADKNTVSGNKIVCNIKTKGKGDGTGDGIRLTSSCNNTIKKNTIVNKVWSGQGKEMNGISVLESSEGNKIISNKISDTSMHGITLKESGNNTVKSNKISKTRKADSVGILVAERSDNVTVQGNTVANTKSDGIRASTSSKNVRMVSNKISGYGRYGLFSSNNATVTASKNKISGDKKTQMRCSGGAKINGKTSVN